MVAAEKDGGHFLSAEHARSRVVRMVEITVPLKGLLNRRSVVSQNTGQESHRRFHNRKRGQLATGEDIVANRQTFETKTVLDALVEPLVASAEQKNAFFRAERVGCLLMERRSGRTHHELAEGAMLGLQPFDAIEDGFWPEHHARPSTKRTIVHRAVTIPGEVAEVDHFDASCAFLLGDAYDARAQVEIQGLGKQR